MPEPGEAVEALAARRAAARRERDFALADALRDELASLGYRMVDRPDGYDLEPLALEAAPARIAARDVVSVLDEPPTVDVTLQWVVEGWPEDVVRAISSFRAHPCGLAVQDLVVDVVGTDASVFPEGVEVLALEEGTGWGAARAAGLRRSRGEITVILDGSVESLGDSLGPIAAALTDRSVGVVGPFGVVTDDLREFREDAGPEVDAIEGYLLAARRETLVAAGGFDERFRFYRTADIDLCFRIRDMGLRAMVVDLPVERHEHRMWHGTAEAERDAASKRNFYRFLERFRGRDDLIVRRDGGAG